MMRKKIIIFCLLVLSSIQCQAQNIQTLEAYFDVVLLDGFGVDIAKTDLKVAEYGYKYFKTQLKPQVNLNVNLPTFIRTSSSVRQPNGSITFQPIYQNNASVSLGVSQPIMLTGGTLFFETSLDRFDDFGQNVTLYNGIPYRLGYSQSLIGYNRWKWAKKIEQFKLMATKKKYNFEMANAKLQAVSYYFDALISESNYNITESNRNVNEKLLVISNERFALGKISEDEKLQMESEYKQSVMQTRQALNILNQSKNRMNNLMKNPCTIESDLEIPTVFTLDLQPLDRLVERSLTNAPAMIQAMLDIENQKNVAAQLKSELSPKFEIFTSIGRAKNGNQWSEIYNNPFIEQQISLSIEVPILDWGRKKSAIQMSNHQIEKMTILADQQKTVIINTVKQLNSQLIELQSRLTLQKELMDISERRYLISTERYTVGAILLTELVFAQRNKDQAIRDYLASLRDYYLAYYELEAYAG